MSDFEFSGPPSLEGIGVSDASRRVDDFRQQQLFDAEQDIATKAADAYTDSDGSFASPAPTTLAEAIRRIAAAVKTDIGVDIP